MKHKTITTDKATLLVVEMPEGAKHVRVETNQSVIPYGKEVNYEVPATKESYGYEETEGFALPEGNWQLLDRYPDITESQMSDIVESDPNILPFSKWEEDFNKILQANEIYFENPLGKLHPTHPSYTGEGITVKEWLEKCKKWQEAQSKVWDKERTYILTKVD